jgi:hypothetical protein
MRTTLTLEPDVALKLSRRMKQDGLTLKQAVNQALRTGLAAPAKPRKAGFKVEPHSFRAKPGIDFDKLGQLADELEVEEYKRKLAR